MKGNSIIINSISHSHRYFPHTIYIRYYSVKFYRICCSINFICRKHHISETSFMCLNKRSSGARDFIRDKSYRSITPHTDDFTVTELKWVHSTHHRNPHISTCEMYAMLSFQKDYSLHYGFHYKVYVALNFLALRNTNHSSFRYIATDINTSKIDSSKNSMTQQKFWTQ